MRFKNFRKSLFILCLTACLIFALAAPAFAYSTDYPNTWTNTGDQRLDVVEIARTQVGYGEVNYETKYGAWWTEFNGNVYDFTTQPWCAMFSLWCENQAGCTNGVYGMSASSSGLLSLYQKGTNGNVAYSFGSGYDPRPGDIIFVGYYGGDTTNHVGLVAAVDDTTIYTIEGNSAGDRVCNVTYSRETGCRPGSSRAITWFGVPNYSNDSSATFNGPVQETITEESIDSTEVNYSTVITGDVLNVRSLPRNGASVQSYVMQGTIVDIVAEAQGNNGHLWGKLSSGGWICLLYTAVGDAGHSYQGNFTAMPQKTSETPAASDPDAVICSGKITASTLNVRKSASTSSEIVGSLKSGESVSIVELASGNGLDWGRLSSGGWVAMKYISTGSSTGSSGSSASSSGTAVSISGTITADLLNVRQVPSTGKVVATLKNGEKVTVTETMTVSGSLWGKVSAGWISMNYFKEDSAASSSSSASSSSAITGTIIADSLNVRSKAGNGEIIAFYYQGESVSITETTNVNGVLWGKTSKGWICMSYVSTGESSPSSGSGSAAAITGKVIADLLNVRSEPATGTVVDSLRNGTAVSVTETKSVNGVLWGKVSSGWISMAYVDTVSGGSGSSIPQESGVSTVTVIGDMVNVRSGAGTDNTIESVVYMGDSLKITETVNVSGLSWGHIQDSGWICMSYTKAA